MHSKIRSPLRFENIQTPACNKRRNAPFIRSSTSRMGSRSAGACVTSGAGTSRVTFMDGRRRRRWRHGMRASGKKVIQAFLHTSYRQVWNQDTEVAVYVRCEL